MSVLHPRDPLSNEDRPRPATTRKRYGSGSAFTGQMAFDLSAPAPRPARATRSATAVKRSSTQGSAQEAKPCSVWQAMHIARGALEKVQLTVVGEVSSFNDKPGYSAAYFDLADDKATMSAMMWHERYLASDVRLRKGMLVQVTGFFTAYEKKGRMQFSVTELRMAGEGELRMRVAQLAAKLEREGLMDPARKRPLPQLPERIGLVTSYGGKAVWDVIRTLRRRYPTGRLLFAGVQVEGQRAPSEIRAGLEAVVAGGAQVVLLVRGGGSYEDLMPFNDEGLARALAACPVPVVTGIGHEPDNSISDMVADVRCSTPTAAAEACAPSTAELAARLSHEGHRLTSALSSRVQTLQSQVDQLAGRPVMSDAHALLGPSQQTLDHLADRLYRAVPGLFEQRCLRLETADKRLRALGPRLLTGTVARVEQDGERLDHVAGRIVEGQAERLERSRQRLDHVAGRIAERPAERVRAGASRLDGLAGRLLAPFGAEVARLAQALEGLSPLAVLGRGYAVARNEAGAIVSSVAQVKPGEGLQVTVADGLIDATVTAARPASGDNVSDTAAHAAR